MIFVYDLIEELCMKKGITVTTLCKDCKIPRSILTDYKKGRLKSLSADTLCKIADYFDVSVDFICGVDEINPNEEALKKYLFGDGFNVSDDVWAELKKYAQFLKEREINK